MSIENKSKIYKCIDDADLIQIINKDGLTTFEEPYVNYDKNDNLTVGDEDIQFIFSSYHMSNAIQDKNSKTWYIENYDGEVVRLDCFKLVPVE